jgi:hypothetical protein
MANNEPIVTINKRRLNELVIGGNLWRLSDDMIQQLYDMISAELDESIDKEAE